jgi:hypothetical protein
MKFIFSIVFVFFLSVARAQKDSTIQINDSIPIITIRDIGDMMKVLENEPGYTKHDFDQVNKAINYLVRMALQRRQKPIPKKK